MLGHPHADDFLCLGLWGLLSDREVDHREIAPSRQHRSNRYRIELFSSDYDRLCLGVLAKMG